MSAHQRFNIDPKLQTIKKQSEMLFVRGKACHPYYRLKPSFSHVKQGIQLCSFRRKPQVNKTRIA